MIQRNIIIAIVVILLFIGIGYYFLEPQPERGNNNLPVPQETVSPSGDPNKSPTTAGTDQVDASPDAGVVKPIVITPQPNSKVISPFVVSGSVPPGWMFEGVFPIKLLDAGRNI